MPVSDASCVVVWWIGGNGIDDLLHPIVVERIPICLELFHLRKGKPKVGAHLPHPNHLSLLCRWVISVDECLPMPIIFVVDETVPRVVINRIRLLIGNRRDIPLTYTIDVFAVFHHLLPGTLFNNLAP